MCEISFLRLGISIDPDSSFVRLSLGLDIAMFTVVKQVQFARCDFVGLRINREKRAFIRSDLGSCNYWS